MDTRKIEKEVAAAEILMSQMAEVLAEDEELRASTLEGETNLFEAVDKALGILRLTEANAEGLGLAIAGMKARQDRLRKRAEYIRTVLLNAMEIAGHKKMERPLATLSRRPVPPKVLIEDEAAIPADYWKPADPKLDRKALLEALKEGAAIEGATLSNGGETVSCKWS